MACWCEMSRRHGYEGGVRSLIAQVLLLLEACEPLGEILSLEFSRRGSLHNRRTVRLVQNNIFCCCPQQGSNLRTQTKSYILNGVIYGPLLHVRRRILSSEADAVVATSGKRGFLSLFSSSCRLYTRNRRNVTCITIGSGTEYDSDIFDPQP